MEKFGAIYETMLSEGWQEMSRQIKVRMDAAMLQLADVKRPAEPSDDALRGLISALKWVLDFELRVNREIASRKADKEAAQADDSAVGSPMMAEPEEPTE